MGQSSEPARAFTHPTPDSQVAIPASLTVCPGRRL